LLTGFPIRVLVIGRFRRLRITSINGITENGIILRFGLVSRVNTGAPSNMGIIGSGVNGADDSRKMQGCVSKPDKHAKISMRLSGSAALRMAGL